MENEYFVKLWKLNKEDNVLEHREEKEYRSIW